MKFIRFLYLSLLIILCFEAHAQKENLVWATLDKNYSGPLVYLTWDSISCGPKYVSGELTNDRSFAVLDIMHCDGKPDKWYLIFTKGAEHYIHKMSFPDTSRIDAALEIFKKNTPRLEDRLYIAMVDNLEKEKKSYDILKKTADSTEKSLNAMLANMRAKNYVISNFDWHYESKYSIMPTVEIAVINPYPKKIKYFYFTVAAYNAVDDYIGSTTLTGIGPIEYTNSGSYSFDNTILSKVVNYMVLKQLKILFFDGSTKIISNPKNMNLETE